MKRNITFLALAFAAYFLVGFASQPNFFEGKITYKCAYESYQSGMTAEELTAMYGDTYTLYIKDGYYKQIFNSTHPQGIREVIYDASTNKVYMKIGDVPALFWYEGTSNDFDLVDLSMSESQTKVLENACNQIKFNFVDKRTSSNSPVTSTYYFSRKFMLNANAFQNHKYGFWDVYSQKAQAPYLKYERVTKGLNKITRVAVDIQEQILKTDDFMINPELPLIHFDDADWENLPIEKPVMASTTRA